MNIQWMSKAQLDKNENALGHGNMNTFLWMKRLGLIVVDQENRNQRMTVTEPERKWENRLISGLYLKVTWN